MAKSTRRPQQLYQIVMWILSVIFAGFLIGFGSLIIRDLPQVDRSFTIEDFADSAALQSAEIKLDQTRDRQNQLQRSVEDNQTALRRAQADYNSAKQSFDNWIATRSATESAATNPEVLKRTRDLERLQERSRSQGQALEAAQNELRLANRANNDASSARRQIIEDGRPAYRKAQRAQELRVFLYRLALTLPLLLISAWLLMKQRGSAYWPLYRGFVLFSLFAFFVELVPYLPSYGGYIRFAVGIIGIAIAGHFLIRGMRSYLARKQAEESRSEGERRQSIAYETALKKIAAKTCPGCDRTIITRDGVKTDFCVHCGIRLQSDCQSCGQTNVSFHKFCLSCGTPSTTAPQDDAPSTA